MQGATGVMLSEVEDCSVGPVSLHFFIWIACRAEVMSGG